MNLVASQILKDLGQTCPGGDDVGDSRYDPKLQEKPDLGPNVLMKCGHRKLYYSAPDTWCLMCAHERFGHPDPRTFNHFREWAESIGGDLS